MPRFKNHAIFTDERFAHQGPELGTGMSDEEVDGLVTAMSDMPNTNIVTIQESIMYPPTPSDLDIARDGVLSAIVQHQDQPSSEAADNARRAIQRLYEISGSR